MAAWRGSRSSPVSRGCSGDSGGEGMSASKPVISVHGTLAMILLVALVAVTQAATNERVTVISSDASRMTRSVKWG